MTTAQNTPTEPATFVADFGPGQVFERRQIGRHPFTHAAMRAKATAGPRVASFHRSEEEARGVAGSHGKVVPVTVKKA